MIPARPALPGALVILEMQINDLLAVFGEKGRRIPARHVHPTQIIELVIVVMAVERHPDFAQTAPHFIEIGYALTPGLNRALRAAEYARIAQVPALQGLQLRDQFIHIGFSADRSVHAGTDQAALVERAFKQARVADAPLA